MASVGEGPQRATLEALSARTFTSSDVTDATDVTEGSDGETPRTEEAVEEVDLALFQGSLHESYGEAELLEILRTPRLDDDDGPVRSFEADIVNRYAEALHTLFPDERVRLVDEQKKASEASATGDAERLEMQKEFG